MKGKKVLLTRIFPAIGAKLLEDEGFSVTRWNKERPMTHDELIQKAQGHQAIFCSLSDQINKRFFDENPQLEIIAQLAAGFDNIDLDEANRCKIPVGYTPNILSEATADIAFGLMIATSRKMFYLHKNILKGEWKYFTPNTNLGTELKNRTLGILGLGSIGMEMAKRCKGAYNMRVIYHNRKPNHLAEEQLDASYVSFETLLNESDVLSVHCNLNDETKGLFNKAAFKAMKPGAIFINTARGQVHNETDLIEALQNGEIWGAGLDVSNPEPMHPDNPLLQMANVAVLPHIGSGTVQTRDAMARMTAMNIIEYYQTNKVPFIVNPEVLKK